ncbi:hypothetical protein QFC19_006729 [Naganishia cerealis]|uniref:Uncharacterized protein n=1 Tax=Naganishia cerealis TaxID=610337 RepID=A0ACC2VDS6_9TREE|nr:hypothetical protein QFC19_006729 [Naganishia cerealis]
MLYGDSAFQDKYGHKDEATGNDLANMVIICSVRYSPLLAFRPPDLEDYLKSPLRLHVLGSFLQYEMLPDHFIDDFEFEHNAEQYEEARVVRDILHKGDGMNTIDKWQVGSAIVTWNAMREIMPVDAWMTY